MSDNSTMLFLASLEYGAGIALGVVSSLGLLLSTIILVAFAYSSNSKVLGEACVTSFLLADIISFFFGILKTALIFAKPAMVNCFLAEGLLFCGTLAHCLSQLLWTVYLNTSLTPMALTGQNQENHKRTTIFALLFIWNFAFIVGFLPQMTWTSQKFTCRFYEFFQLYYLILFSAIVHLSNFLSIVFIWKLMRSLSRTSNAASASGLLLRELLPAATATSVLAVLFLTPSSAFLLLHCPICLLPQPYYTNAVLRIFYVAMCSKSLLDLPVYLFKIPEIRATFADILTNQKSWQCTKSRPCCHQTSVDLELTTSTSSTAVYIESTTPRGSDVILKGTNTIAASHQPKRTNCSPYFSCVKCGHTNAFSSASLQAWSVGSGLDINNPNFVRIRKSASCTLPSVFMLPGRHHDHKCPLYCAAVSRQE